ncbi:hypothetical protein CEUSTIGMA_g1133.t1 [Chlamydomonas eustigma]|uniref:FAM91 N-terminal domain-containing protein n=1 Tax=Chlamydomonas eustigma TaxID=1157962 RepID=A0A250WSP9_9CHLO|nr:hypothetical protein CEUSTIGMA_g1133.t1 [Chlamydomonas eustigma]|eukprot:GAX73682.1 hypothetical protein CEUSTIGMA_g1133.t1 [Chlamydomonas eustigma]
MSAYSEYVSKAIATGRVYEELPQRIQNALTPYEWKLKVKQQCIQRGVAWHQCIANTVCGEEEYYDDLLKAYKGWLRMYPHHLATFVCKCQRVTPFKYYCEVLANMLREEKSYDRMPNFTAADVVQVLGVGRNEYIAMLNQCKGRKLMWRLNPRGLAREVLPTQPCMLAPQPWWIAAAVNIVESELRDLSPEEIANLKTAALPQQDGGTCISDLDPIAVAGLHRRSLVYFDIPIQPDDRFLIPPLEGFVSNRTPIVSEASDPLEPLLYSIFVASSENLRVSDLAQILGVGLQEVQMALSVAVRLGFATRIFPPYNSSSRTKRRVDSSIADHELNTAAAATGGDLISLDSGEGAGTVPSLPPHTQSNHKSADYDPQQQQVRLSSSGVSNDLLNRRSEAGGHDGLDYGASSTGGAAGGGRAVALLLDAEATSYLMMGALSPGLKRHSVTLFEGGRVGGDAVMSELIDELWQSYEAGQGFEGDMLKLTLFVGALATSLEALKEGSGGRPLELLRKESLAGLPAASAQKVLYHAYCAVVPAAPLPGPTLPLGPEQPGPAYFGHLGAAAGPWMQLTLYCKAQCGPKSVVLVKGQRLHKLPPELLLNRRCTHGLIWPWQAPDPRATVAGHDGAWGLAVAAAGAEGSSMVLVEINFLLYMLNEALLYTSVMVQALDGFSLLEASRSAAAAAAQKRSRPEDQGTMEIKLLDSVAKDGMCPQPSALPSSPTLLGDLMQLEESLLTTSPLDNEDDAVMDAAAECGLAAGAMLVDVPLPFPDLSVLIKNCNKMPVSNTGGCQEQQVELEASSSHADEGSNGIAGRNIDSSYVTVQGVERHSSAKGKSVQVQVQSRVVEAISALGLRHCPGVLRMVLWPDVPHACWLPLSVTMGLPLHCLPLCSAVCARALNAGFLTTEGRAAQSEGQAILASAITELVDQHVIKEPASCDQRAAEGKQLNSSLRSIQKEPRFNLYFDGRELRRIDLRKYVQGAPSALTAC